MYLKRRRGSIMLVIVILSVFFIFALGVLFRSSGERKHVKQMHKHQSAEKVAMSGINWAEGQLLKERWYANTFKKGKINKGNISFGKKALDFPNNGGSVTVVCQDVANRIPLWDIDGDFRKYGGLEGTVNDVSIANLGMKELWLLHHIDVYSLANYDGKQCLIYGRFIMSPEPALNGNSTDGIKYSNKNMNPYRLSMIAPEKTNTGYEVKKYTVKKLVRTRQAVNANTVLVELTADNGEIIKLSPPCTGKATNLISGSDCTPGTTICIIDKQPRSRRGKTAITQTLKKMVRITKIDLGLFPNFDINNLAHRGAISTYIEQLSDIYMKNYVAHNILQNKITKLSISSIPENMSASELLNTFPPHVQTMTRDRTKNEFLAAYISNFVAPGCPLERADLVKKQAYLKLAHEPTQPPRKLVADLQKLGRLDALNSRPRADRRLYKPRLRRDEFKSLLADNTTIRTSEYAKRLTGLDDAARNINIVENLDSNGVVTSTNVSVQKIRKEYSFVDPVNVYTVGMNDLVAFAEKYFSTQNSDFPKEEYRTLDHIEKGHLAQK